jgi:hypothetical protein
MQAPQQKLSRGAVIGVCVAGVLLVLVAGYFMLIGPQRAKIAHAKAETAHVRKEIADVQATTAKRKSEPKIRYANLYQVSKAMPDSTDLPDVILALVQLAHQSGITITKIGAAPVANLPLYQELPLQISFSANYYELSDFLFRLRNLVRVRNGVLEASGRLYAIDHIDISQPGLGESYPTVDVSLQVSAFVYGSATAAPAAAPTSAATDTTSGDTTTTSTDTTATTTTPAPETTTPAAFGGNP